MKWKDHLRIIRVIALKDIVDALRNKLILTILASVAFMMISSQALSYITGLKEEPFVYVADQGRSLILRKAVRSREMALVPVDSREEMLSRVGDSPSLSIGLLLPPDFDTLAGGDGPVELAMFASNRDTEANISESITQFETDFAALTNVSVTGRLQPERAYPLENSSDYPMMLSIGLVMGVMTIGMVLTPFLMIDEKESHTLDAMLISPARHIHLVTGKMLTGLLYSVSGSLLIIVFSRQWITHWGILLGAVVLGALVASALGLLTGIIFTHTASTSMMGGLLMAVLMLPMFFWQRLSTLLSSGWVAFISWMPSIRMYRLVRQAFVYAPLPESVWLNLLGLTAFGIFIVVLLVWRIRLLDR